MFVPAFPPEVPDGSKLGDQHGKGRMHENRKRKTIEFNEQGPSSKKARPAKQTGISNAGVPALPTQPQIIPRTNLTTEMDRQTSAELATSSPSHSDQPLSDVTQAVKNLAGHLKEVVWDKGLSLESRKSLQQLLYNLLCTDRELPETALCWYLTQAERAVQRQRSALTAETSRRLAKRVEVDVRYDADVEMPGTALPALREPSDRPRIRASSRLASDELQEVMDDLNQVSFPPQHVG